MSNHLPEEGYVRLAQIIGDKNKGILPVLPIGRTAWHLGVVKGIYPKPFKIGRTALYKVSEIRDLIKKIEQGGLV